MYIYIYIYRLKDIYMYMLVTIIIYINDANKCILLLEYSLTNNKY